MKKIALLALVAAAGSASAQYTFPTIGNTFVNNQWNAIQLDDSMVPAGTYSGFTITVDWTSDPEDPTSNLSNAWSNEARVSFADDAGSDTTAQPTYPAGTTIYASTTNLTGGTSNSLNTSLSATGILPTRYTGGNLYFNFRQAFAGANVVNWDNISITLIPEGLYVPGAPSASPPAATDLGNLGDEANFVIDTFGSNFDTELGLYAQDGMLIANNDDFSSLQSQIDVAGTTPFSGLGEGTYYIALGGFNTIYGMTDFGVTAGNASGDYILSVNGQVVSTGSHPTQTVTWYSFEVSDSGPVDCLGDIADDFGFTAIDGGGPDGVVDFGDFVALLGLIGPCDGGVPGCLGDIADDFGFTAIDGGGPDGVVDFGDFVALLGLIGPCP